SDVVRSLRATGWIEAHHYITGHHVDYDAYWRHVSYGALMSDIARCGNIDIPGRGALIDGVTFLRVEFFTIDFSTQATQILPPRLEYRLSQLNDYFDGEGVVVDWEDDESEAETSQAGTSRGRGLRGITSQGGPLLPLLDDQDERGDRFSCLVSLMYVIVVYRYWPMHILLECMDI
ncbi:hypothetical protein GIB67_037421, partial [Kingdonia uniflora]